MNLSNEQSNLFPIYDSLTRMENLVEDFVNKYMSEDGLCRLDLQDDQEGFPPSIERTVKNQNGIMFLAEVLLSLKLKGMDVSPFRMSVQRTLDKLFIPKTGCTNRRPNETHTYDSMDSHDNMLGTIVLCQIFGLDIYIERICTWGRKEGWCFNNLNPGVFDIRAVRQGFDIAIYELSNGDVPYMLNILWLIGASCLTQDLRLLKLRLESVKMADEAYRNGWLAKTVLSIIYSLKGGDKKFAIHIEDYFKDPAHPMRRLWGNS